MTTTHEVLGKTVTMPVEVRDASAATVIWEVDAAAVSALLPGDAFEVVESSPGRAQFAIALVDYRDNDLGSYFEVGLIAFVRPVAGGMDGSFILRLPVDQEFTCHAGRDIWGFPKTIEQISFDYADTSLTATLSVEGELVLRLVVPRGGSDDLPDLPMASYTLLDGRPHSTRFTQRGKGTQVLFGGEGVTLELGSHPWAKELASLGLPAEPLLSTWNETMTATFEDAVPL
jgi:hypothetical protein